MNLLTGNFRIGQDPELKYTQSGQPYIALSLASDYGKADQGGKRPTQWIRAAVWGSRAEELVDRCVKGAACWAALSDLHVREYEGKNGPGVSLEARVELIHVFPPRSREDSPVQQRHQQEKANGYQASAKFQGLQDDDVAF